MLTYVLEWSEAIDQTAVKYSSNTVTVQMPFALASHWGKSSLVGLSNTLDLGSAGTLSVLVEKDFACLDQSDADNEGTFPNPHANIVC